MAEMIPSTIDREAHPQGEITLFDLLSELPDQIRVFHSVPWQTRQPGRRSLLIGEADFLIFIPDRGLICLEVKDGDILFSRQSGWIQFNRKTRKETLIDPFAQARRSEFFFLGVLKARFSGSPPFSVCSAVCFTSIEGRSLPTHLPPECDRKTILTGDDLASPTTLEMALHGVLNHYGATRNTNHEDYLQKTLEALLPEFQVFESPRSLLNQTERLFHRLTREQSTLLDYLEEQQTATIKGLAGTGKTVLAVEKAKRLALEGEVLFLCFNTYLRNHLEQAYAQPGITFTNLDSLLVRLSGKPLPLEQYQPGAKDNQILEMLLSFDEYNLPYKHFVVDEGQDFVEDHLVAIQEIARRKGGCFYIFYDAHQFVQGSEFPEWLRNADCRLVLSRNCRNTREIALTSAKPVGIDPRLLRMLKESQALPSSTKPGVVFVKNVEETKSALLRIIREKTTQGLSLDRIVVLTTGSTERSVLGAADLRLLPSIELSYTPSSGKVFFTTIRRFKGLEADAIILIDVDWQTFQSEPQRRAFYVGASRAKIWLDILVQARNNEDLTKLANTMTGERHSSQRSKVAIANWLQVIIKQ